MCGMFLFWTKEKMNDKYVQIFMTLLVRQQWCSPWREDTSKGRKQHNMNCTTDRIWICWQDKIKINHSLNGILGSWHDQLLEHAPQLPVSVNIFHQIRALLIYEVQIIKANDLLSNNSNLANTTTQSEVCSICVTPFPETDDKQNSKGLLLFP